MSDHYSQINKLGHLANDLQYLDTYSRISIIESIIPDSIWVSSFQTGSLIKLSYRDSDTLNQKTLSVNKTRMVLFTFRGKIFLERMV